ncbi:hypothetical protein FNV43_RR05394 [Rhamnella rubrinervis]|uniref:Uncharacterized protein n=1 Tax=Rhamnella rubrinervis TaxID=2594499 RepID=A0A8K0HM07_9ROSA|nr:hypothetical protein FNV43_RR05394 [Rhamnella rubrinervis]
MSWLSKELVFVILQYVDEEKFSETVHKRFSAPQWPPIFKYRYLARTQSPKVEMIDSLYKKVSDTKDDGIMRELLLEFYTSSGKRKPDQIVIFSYAWLRLPSRLDSGQVSNFALPDLEAMEDRSKPLAVIVLRLIMSEPIQLQALLPEDPDRPTHQSLALIMIISIAAKPSLVHFATLLAETPSFRASPVHHLQPTFIPPQAQSISILISSRNSLSFVSRPKMSSGDSAFEPFLEYSGRSASPTPSPLSASSAVRIVEPNQVVEQNLIPCVEPNVSRVGPNEDRPISAFQHPIMIKTDIPSIFKPEDMPYLKKRYSFPENAVLSAPRDGERHHP